MFNKLKISNKEKEAILGLLPLLLFFMVQICHDLGSPKFGEDVLPYIHTNWSIFYFSGIFLSFMFYIVLKIKKITGLYKWIYVVFGLSLFTATIIEISKWNSDFYEYIKSVNTLEKGVFLIAIVLVGLILVLIFKKIIEK